MAPLPPLAMPMSPLRLAAFAEAYRLLKF